MTVKEARKLLGKDGESLSDDQVEEVVGQLEVIAGWAIKDYLKNKH